MTLINRDILIESDALHIGRQWKQGLHLSLNDDTPPLFSYMPKRRASVLYTILKLVKSYIRMQSISFFKDHVREIEQVKDLEGCT